MKAINPNFISAPNISVAWQDSKGNLFLKNVAGHYRPVYEEQIFDDLGNVSYALTYGNRALAYHI